MSELIEAYSADLLKQRAQLFLERFMAPGSGRSYILGRNVYTREIVKHFVVAGIVDDYTNESTFGDLPVIRTQQLRPGDAVLVASGGKPLSARAQLEELGVIQLDYFAFQKHAAPYLPELVFNEGFEEEFTANRQGFEDIYARLQDLPSKAIFKKLINFRLTQDLSFLEGFQDRQQEQYFEDFLQLRQTGETFLDVGCFDGQTSVEFARRAPGYAAIHAFEPEPRNAERCKLTLDNYRDVTLHPYGLSNANQTLQMASDGSGSSISVVGTTPIEVRRLDDILPAHTRPTLVKIDIEGAETLALEGAQQILVTHKPRLAISIYHRPADFWRLPQHILELVPGYRLYLRHYTESIYETVMFFLPD